MNKENTSSINIQKKDKYDFKQLVAQRDKRQWVVFREMVQDLKQKMEKEE